MRSPAAHQLRCPVTTEAAEGASEDAAVDEVLEMNLFFLSVSVQLRLQELQLLPWVQLSSSFCYSSQRQCLASSNFTTTPIKL